MNATGTPLGGAPELNCETANGERVRDAVPARKPGRKTDRKSPQRGPVVAEPVTYEFWKNRSGASVRVTVQTFDGTNVVDIRQCFTNPEGKSQPTKKGICMSVLRLPDLVDALTKARDRAIELGLIKAEHGQ